MRPTLPGLAMWQALRFGVAQCWPPTSRAPRELIASTRKLTAGQADSGPALRPWTDSREASSSWLVGFGSSQTAPSGSTISAWPARTQPRIDGAATPERAYVAATMTIPSLARADDRLTGRAEIHARVTGTLERPDATASLAVSQATAFGRPVPRLVLEVDAKDIRGAIDARVTLDGDVDRKPARGTLHASRDARGGTTVDAFDVRI